MANDPRVGGPTGPKGPQGTCMADGTYVYEGADLEASAMAVDAMPDSVDKARHLMGLGAALIRKEGHQQAGIARFQEAVHVLNIMRGAYQFSDTAVSIEIVLEARTQLASALEAVGRQDEAREIFKEIAQGWVEIVATDLQLQREERLLQDCLETGRVLRQARDFPQAKEMLERVARQASERGDMEMLVKALQEQFEVMNSMGDQRGANEVDIYLRRIRALLEAEFGLSGPIIAADRSVRAMEFGNARRLYAEAFRRLVDGERFETAAQFLMEVAENTPELGIEWRIEAMERVVSTFTVANDIENAQKARRFLMGLYREAGDKNSAFRCEGTFLNIEGLLPRLRAVLAGRHPFIRFTRDWQVLEQKTVFEDASLEQWVEKNGRPLEAMFGPHLVGELADAIRSGQIDANGFYTRRRKGAEIERRDLLDPMREGKRGK